MNANNSVADTHSTYQIFAFINHNGIPNEINVE